MKSKNNPPTASNPIPTFTFLHGCSIIVPVLILSCGVASAVDLLKWDVTGVGASTGSDVATAAALGVSGSVLTGGGSTGNSSSPGATWNRTFDPAADYTAAQTAGNYFSFTTTAESGYTVSFTGLSAIGFRRTTAIGETNVGLFYSSDNITFTQTGNDYAVTTTNDSAAAEFSATMSGTPIVMNGGETIYWRIVVAGNAVSGRVGINKGVTDDIVFTGTSVPDVAVRNLLWTGSGGSDWNTTPANTNWADIDDSNNPAPFATNDNVTIDTAATIAVDAGGVSPGNVLVSATTGTISLSGGAISGLSLTKSGGSTLTIDGTNSFTAGASLEGGILTMENPDALGSGIISLNGGTLNTPAAVTLVANTVSVGTSGGVIDTDGDVTFSDFFSASGAGIEESNQLTKTGAGVLTLTKTGSSAFGAQSNVGAAGTSIELDIAAGGVVFSGSGSRYLGGTCTWDAPVTFGGGTVMLHGSVIDGSGAISVTSASTLVSRFNRGTSSVENPVNLDADLTVNAPTGDSLLSVNGAIGGTASLVKDGNGAVLLTADNTYDGTTTVENGTLRVGGDVTATSGSLGDGDVTLNIGTSTGTIEFSRNNALVIPNTISGAGNVVVNNGASGSTELAGTNDYTGITNLSGGILVASVLADGGLPSSIGSATVDATNFILRGEATLSYTGSATSTDREFSLGGSVNGSTFGGGTISVDGTGPLTFTSTADMGADGSGAATRVLTLAGSAPGISSIAMNITDGQASQHSVVKDGGTTWSLTGINTYTGDTTINNGTLQLGASTDLTDSSIVRINGATSVLQLTDGVTDVVEELWIDGVQMAAGTWGDPTSSPDNSDDDHFNGTGKLSVTTGPSGTDYDTWALFYSLAEGPTGDDDKDGLSNEEEYAFGLIPNSGSSVNPITAQLDKTAGTFTYQRRNPALGTDLTYKVWTSTDLSIWTEDASALTAPTDSGDNQNVVVTLTGIKPLTATKLFVRVTAD